MQEFKETTVRITRPFCMSGEPIPADTVIQLETPFAMELVAMNKAVITAESPRAPATDTPAPKKRGRRAAAVASEQQPENDKAAPDGAGMEG